MYYMVGLAPANAHSSMELFCACKSSMEALYLMSLLILFCCSIDVSAAQDVELNSTLSEGVAYNNQKIFFTCLVRGSNILEWNSAEYIGQGGFPLQLLSLNGSDTNVSSTTRPSTYAVRRSVTTENGQSVIVSDLRIIASTQYPVATVSCSAQSTRNITFQTLSNVMPLPATRDVTLNVTTIQYTSATTMMTTITATNEEFDGRRENQQSYTTGIASLTVILIISLLVNIIVIILIITIIKVRRKGSPARDIEAPATSDSPSGTKNDSQASAKPELSSTKHEEKHKKKFLDVLHSGRELFDCTNPNKVPTESEDLVPALKSLSDALSNGTSSAFKAIKDLTDNLHMNKVSDEVLEGE